MDSFDIMKYLDMAWRRKYWIVLPFLVTILGGLTYTLTTPEVFEAQTLILVQPQKVPSDFVRSIVSIDVEDRLQTISQQVTSRTNLESIIREYGLYDERDMLLEDKVERLRRRINLNVVKGGRGGNAFSITFKGGDPRKVMQVTNALASNFISENLKIRESQAMGTSIFLTDELESIRKRLAEKEELVRDYRQEHMGSLPDQLQTNLSIVGRLQMQLEQLNSNLRDAENRKLIIQKQISDSEMMRKQMAGVPSADSLIDLEPEVEAGGESEDLAAMKKQLEALKSRYTENHPDVRRLKSMIESLEAAEPAAEEEAPVLDEETGTPGAEDEALGFAMPSMEDLLKPQLQQINLEIAEIRAEIEKVQAKIDLHQERIDETPKREQELLSFTRDYENLKKLYDSMLNRKLEAEIAVSMEQKQKGEQFRVLDPAKVPIKPMEPDAKKIMMLTLVLGLGLGCGLAYLVEYLDTSYKNPEEAAKELGLPVLVSVPIRMTEKERKRKLRLQVLAAGSIVVGFVLCAFGIVIGFKGLEPTIGFVKRALFGA